MGKNRLVNTKFWDDPYISELDPIEKLLFLYLLTNPLTNIAGVYEIKLRKIAFDTGIDRDMIAKLFERFEKDGKIKYTEGFVFLVNSIKHQVLNPSVKEGIEKVINNLPNSIKNIVLDSLGTERVQTVLPNLTKPNLNLNINLTEPLTDGSLKNEDQKKGDELFEKFWKLYPRKDGSKSAVKKLLQSENITDPKKFFEAVRNYAADCEDRDMKYIKYPVSFIPVWKEFL